MYYGTFTMYHGAIKSNQTVDMVIRMSHAYYDLQLPVTNLAYRNIPTLTVP